MAKAGAGLPAVTGTDMTELERELATLKREIALLRIANAELERVVVRDTLTPLFNRRYFITCVNDRIGRCARYEARAIVMFVDVDNMKGINDVYGHSAGDYVLMHVAQMLVGSIRATDVAARIGGDEFALILDEMTEAQAEKKMAALDRRLRETSCHFGDTQLPVSASFGFTAVRPADSDITLMDRADEAMYEIKRARRALPEAIVVVSDPTDSSDRAD